MMKDVDALTQRFSRLITSNVTQATTMRLHDAEQRPQAHDPFVFFSAKIPQRLPRKQPNDALLSSYTVPITNFFPNQSLQFYSLSQHVTNPK